MRPEGGTAGSPFPVPRDRLLGAHKPKDGMSKQTLEAIHEAIAAHVADESDGEALLLTDWHMTAAAAVADDMDHTMYFNFGTNSPYHNRLGLLHRGLELLTGRRDQPEE